MMVLFRTRLGNILIWQTFLKPESPTLKVAVSPCYQKMKMGEDHPKCAIYSIKLQDSK